MTEPLSNYIIEFFPVDRPGEWNQQKFQANLTSGVVKGLRKMLCFYLY